MWATDRQQLDPWTSPARAVGLCELPVPAERLDVEELEQSLAQVDGVQFVELG